MKRFIHFFPNDDSFALVSLDWIASSWDKEGGTGNWHHMGGGYFANDSNNSATHYYLKEAIINHGSRHDVTLHRGRVEVVVARTRTRGVLSLSLPMRSDWVYGNGNTEDDDYSSIISIFYLHWRNSHDIALTKIDKGCTIAGEHHIIIIFPVMVAHSFIE